MTDELTEAPRRGRPPGVPNTIEAIDKHVATVKVQNMHESFIDMKHQRLQKGAIGLATIAEQEALHMFLKIIE